jgi:hypothetical protein
MHANRHIYIGLEMKQSIEEWRKKAKEITMALDGMLRKIYLLKECSQWHDRRFAPSSDLR